MVLILTSLEKTGMFKKYIGCSGYYYNHWKGVFYPENLSKAKWLPFYAELFNTVEINSSFYHLPLDTSLLNWYSLTPKDFVFTLKGYRYITHLKKLNVDNHLLDILHDFQRKAYLLKDKLGCILWQLPGSQGKDLQKLEQFCNSLDTSVSHVFEFRHNSWFSAEVYQLLKSYNFALCMLSAPGNIPEMVFATSEIAYLRFHGKNGWYDDNYSDQQLNIWVEKLKPLSVNRLYAYFNNDFHGFAVNNGMYFSKAIETL